MPECAPDTGQPRARSDIARPQTKPEAPRFRKTSKTAHSRMSLEGTHRRRTPEAVQPSTKPEVPRIRTTSGTVRVRTTSETISFRTGFVQQGTLSEFTESQTEPKTRPPSKSLFPGRYLSKILMIQMSQHLNVGRNGFVDCSNPVVVGKGPFLHPSRFTHTQVCLYLTRGSIDATLEYRST